MYPKFSFLALVLIAFAWSATAQTSSSQSSSNAAATASGGTTINAVLDKSIDAKKAKAGDQVEAKTTADAMVGATSIPRGSKLVGHITEAKPHEKGNAESSLGIQFDQAVIKGGQQVPIHAVIQAIAASQAAPIEPAPDTATAPVSTGSSGGYNPRSGPASRAAADQGPPATSSSAPIGGMAGTAADTTAGMPPSAAGGQLNPHMTGVIGMKDLKLDSESAQGSVITSDNKNVKLDGGTHLLLRVTAQ